jgi:outer membrane protein OmpA-like peptidoglycan-associated protein
MKRLRSARGLACAAYLLWCGVSAISVAAQPAAALKDVSGAKDPAGIKRYDGSIIIGYKFEKFGEFTFPLGPLAPAPAGGERLPSKAQHAEGQRTRVLYTAPVGRSSLEVLRNYEQELVKAGFATVYQCAASQCGDSNVAEHYLWTMENRLSNYPPPHSGRAPGQVTEYAFSSAKDQRLLTAHRTGAAGDAWVSVYVAVGAFDMHAETNNHPLALVDLVESAAMETKMVTVDASAMARGIAATGHVALYGILFDTAKTDIKPESTSTIAEVAKYLKQNPSVKLYVVGHTDNVGGHDYNMDLSARRAASVVRELTATHAVAAARLKPAGTGPLAPVAPNDAEDGRAKNRRVELVKQ